MKEGIREGLRKMAEYHEQRRRDEEADAKRAMRIIEALPDSDVYTSVIGIAYRDSGTVTIGTYDSGGYDARYKGAKCYTVEELPALLKMLPPMPLVKIEDGYHVILPEECLDEKQQVAMFEGRFYYLNPVTISVWALKERGETYLNQCAQLYAHWFTKLRDDDGEFIVHVKVGLDAYKYLAFRISKDNAGWHWSMLNPPPTGARESRIGGGGDESYQLAWWWPRDSRTAIEWEARL